MASEQVTMTIGQVAKASGLGIDTIRFYEKQGVIEEPARRASGYREYEQAVVPRLMFIRRSKKLGFTLGEIKELLALRLDRRANCARVKRRADAKIADLDTRLRSLLRMKRALEELSAACERGDAQTDDCPILGALEGR